MDLYERLRDIPGVSALFSLAGYFLAQLILLLICILKKRYAVLMPFAVITTVLLTCLISPVHAECRYAFVAIISLPVLAVFVFRDDF